MEREKALQFLNENIKNLNLIKHSLAVEAIMRGLADFFGEDKETWGLAGLLHDIDYEQTKDFPEKHSLIGFDMLKKAGISENICQAVKVHNYIHGELPQTLMEKSLYAADPLSGLIVASALVIPSKKLSDLTVENIMNRFKEKAFARSVNREIIQKCQLYLNLSMEKFIEIGLRSLQGIACDLGL